MNAVVLQAELYVTQGGRKERRCLLAWQRHLTQQRRRIAYLSHILHQDSITNLHQWPWHTGTRVIEQVLYPELMLDPGGDLSSASLLALHSRVMMPALSMHNPPLNITL